jgi:hypothetical protein
MALLNTRSRKKLVENICSKFHKDGIARLGVVGHFAKYTPLFHLSIAEPCKERDFIFITDLFGDTAIEPGLMQRGVRMQYHGNYDGLNTMIVQGIHDGLLIPQIYLPEPGIQEKTERVALNPSFRLHAEKDQLSKKNKLYFDNALRYINHILRFDTPETIHLNSGTETFSSTYCVI